ncbi:hypothetical protein WME99_41050 [Sorangium sp. So ce136]|uniref:hypothetical protein n=1 Tax=Sorangium sp. So ce136 TaxID=3133284 RepID=UPI003EFCBC35
MAQYVAFRPGIEVLAPNLQSFFEAPGRSYTPMIMKIMIKHGLHQLISIDWLPMQLWLDTQREMATTLGEHALFALGKKTPELAVWPSGIDTMETALASVDAAYHLNHRLDGEVMFDVRTGAMKEGIGHYRYRADGDRRAVVVSDTPYSSEFDRGILTGTARRLKPAAEVSLDQTQPTRRRGGDSCTFLVRW